MKRATDGTRRLLTSTTRSTDQAYTYLAPEGAGGLSQTSPCIYGKRTGGTTKFHEIQILQIFGLGLQIMIHLIILASKARDANTMDKTGAAAFGRGPLWCR